MKNLILFTILTIGSIQLSAQESKPTIIDSLTENLIGVWEFIEVVDKDGNKIQSFEREVKGSPLGDKVNIKATGPDILLNDDGSYQLKFTPDNIDKGKWHLSSSDTIIFQLVTKKKSRSYKMLKSAAEMFDKKLTYDKDGNIVENNPRVIENLQSDKMWIQYETKYFQIFRKKE